MPVELDFGGILRHPEVEGLVRIILAGVLCAIIGIEREVEGKPAGMRTYSLSGMGAAIFTVVGIYAFGGGDAGSRIAAQIVTGIGFLGAGTILHWRLQVVGLTTAAGMWVSAAIGMAIGGGLYILGIGAAVVLFIVLQFLQPEKILGSKPAADKPNKPDKGDKAK